MGPNLIDPVLAENAAQYRRTYDAPLSTLLSRIWGGHLHMGLFETPKEPLIAAQLRADRRLADEAGLGAGKELLEVACGVGGTARFLAETCGVRVTATNIAEAQLAEARALTAEAGLSDRVEFAFADYHALPFPDGRFDTWWCQEALLYSTDKRRVLDEALRVVRGDGRVVLSDLLLAESVVGSERERFAAALKAPGIWSIERWDALIAEMPLAVVARHDWSRHTIATFEMVLASLVEVRDAFTATIGAEAVEGTVERVTMQLEAARAGRLGWCAYVLAQRSGGRPKRRSGKQIARRHVGRMRCAVA
jgi:sarcosine/dimethylglycine N-methyltransferase